MALCPDHGGYMGDSCKKCQTPATKPIAIYDGPTPDEVEIDADDQLALYRLERDITVNQQKAQTAQAQFYNFMKVMFEKYGVDGAKYTLDMEKMEFTVREPVNVGR
jgi:hypothetical protein